MQGGIPLHGRAGARGESAPDGGGPRAAERVEVALSGSGVQVLRAIRDELGRVGGRDGEPPLHRMDQRALEGRGPTTTLCETLLALDR